MAQNPRPAAEETHAGVFERLEPIVLQVHDWLHGEPVPSAGTALDNLQIAFIVRALNQYRAILLLLRSNHWEDALILTRALFELLLNVEELVYRQPDKEQAAQRFFLFSSLEHFRETRELRRYDIASGREPPDYAQALDQVEKMGRKAFAPFAYIDRKGRPRWRSHWANRTVADLCHLSPDRMRPHQHRILYSKGSAFTHSAPSAVLAAHAPPTDDFDEFIRFAEAQEDRQLRMVASFSTLFFGDIMAQIGGRLPGFRPEWIAEVVVPAGTGIISKGSAGPGDAAV